MSLLIPKFTVTEITGNLSSIITDKTGNFDPATNTTGYGGTNPALAACSACSIAIYAPDPATLLPVSSPFVTVNLFAKGYPATNNFTTLLNTDYGLTSTTPLADGVYLFVITTTFASVNPIVTTYQWYGIFKGQEWCCKNNLSSQLAALCCDNNSSFKKVMNVMLMRAYLESAQYAQDCPTQNINTAVTNLTKAEELCKGAGCDPCGC